jgi:hypothetical protein
MRFYTVSRRSFDSGLEWQAMKNTGTTQIARARQILLLLGSLLAVATGAMAAPSDAELQEMRDALEELQRRDTEREQRIEELENRLERAEREDEDPTAAPAAPIPGAPATEAGDLWARDVGMTRLRLMDLGVDLIATAGSSSKGGDTLEDLQGGAHDPYQRGFTLNQLEVSFLGAVDPYLRGAAFVVFQVDDQGGTNTELEEAFATTQRLPFALDELGFQFEMGTFLTEFGRVNPTHAHTWDFVDQPFIATRLLGGDGLRGPGVRLGWLAPVPWFAELHLGMQNSRGETQVSFLANDSVFDDRAIGGRPAVYDDVHSLADFTYLVRLANGFDLGDEWSALVGASVVLGPNATGSDAETRIYGADFVAKWQPLQSDRGWPHFSLTGEFMYRDYEAASFAGSRNQAALPSDDLEDWGLYAQAVLGFHRGWSVGARYEYGDASGPNYNAAGARVSRSSDAYRDRRHRVSPVLLFDPTEYSRLRLQYNYDNAQHLSGNDAHSF